MERLKESQLIINPDGSIYHLKLKAENIADTIILVGDPGRVPTVSKYFDRIDFRMENREMITHTGEYKGKKLTVISTGIGPDNIDIVINELDALANIDLNTRQINEKHKSINLIRIGTSGAIQEDIPVDSFAVASYGLGLEGVAHFYQETEAVIEQEMTEAFNQHARWPEELAKPYIIKCSSQLEEKLGKDMISGITTTAPGFYGPQGRTLRLQLKHSDLNEKIKNFSYRGLRPINFEMETSALYALGKSLGHKVLTMCAIVANRASEQYSKNPAKPIDELVATVLDRLVK